MHGAVTLELSGLVRIQDPAVVYSAFLETICAVSSGRPVSKVRDGEIASAVHA